MSNFTLTAEQELCVEAARTSDNLIIHALAGAAKTTTLIEMARALPSTRILCLAFNKKIQKEMEKRMPANCTTKTLNGLGHGIWQNTLGRRLVLNDDKLFGMLKAESEKFSGAEREEVSEAFLEILHALRLAKAYGYVPDTCSQAKPLVTDEELWKLLPEKPSATSRYLIKLISEKSFAKAMVGEIDFADQLLMPALCWAMIEPYDLVMIDEAQDLSMLDHALIAKLAKTRLIAVGDPNQAIYGFRGASSNSMTILQSQFSMRPLHLSTSFRCPTAIVNEVAWKTPEMRAPTWAKPGLVTTISAYDETTFPSECAIICRNNAPLFRLAMRLMKKGRRVELYGTDMTKGLFKILRDLGPASLPIEDVRTKLGLWYGTALEKSNYPGTVTDKYECILTFLDGASTLSEAIAAGEHLFNQQGPIKLMTGHKSKGLEFPNVFFLDADIIKKDGQDPNIRYVIITRTQETLTYITSDGWTEE